jgi:hypothetical protein
MSMTELSGNLLPWGYSANWIKLDLKTKGLSASTVIGSMLAGFKV